MYAEPVEPERRDHYADLGVSESATGKAIKTAFRILALLHHPDKKAPGVTMDAVEFRRAREAFETLRDKDLKEEYDEDYPGIKSEWAAYHAAVAAQKRKEEEEKKRKEAEAEAQRKAAEAEERRRAAEEEGRRRDPEGWKRREEEAIKREEAIEHEKILHRLYGDESCYRTNELCPGCWKRHERQLREAREKRQEEAERRSREAAQRAREEQERQARERMAKEKEAAERKQKAKQQAAERKQKAKERAAEARSGESARRAREMQEKAAHIRMAHEHIKEQIDKFLKEIAGRGEEAGRAGEEVVVDIGWTKKKGVGPNCFFCDKKNEHYSFRCPSGGAVACNPCKNKLSRFTLPKTTDVDGDEDGDDGVENGLGEGEKQTPSR